jgi:hypothetical protein
LQKVVELRQYLLIESISPQEGLKCLSIHRFTLMKAEEGMSYIERSMLVFDLRNGRNFPSQSRVWSTHDD